MSSTDGHSIKTRKWFFFFGAAAVLGGLYLLSLHSYLLFHSVSELFSISVAFAIFLLVYNVHRFAEKDYVTFIGVSFLFIGILDLLHTLAYKGMAIFPDGSANAATQLWIASRYMQSLSFIAAAFFIKRKVNMNAVISVYVIITSAIILSISYWKIFPACYVEGAGLTDFKKLSEYIIICLFFASILILAFNRKQFKKTVLAFLIFSLISSILSEITFTLYTDVYGRANLVGHLLRLVSFYLIYRALIRQQLIDPYGTLFRTLKQKESALAEQSKRLEKILDTVPDGICIVNQDYDIEYANPAIQKMMGTAEGKKCYQYFQHNNEPCEVCKFTEMLKGKTIHETYENGSGRIYDVVDAPFLNFETGEMSKFKCLHDITEQKREQELLLKNREQIRAKLESIIAPQGDIGNLELGDIINIPEIQEMMDNFYKLAHIPMSIIDVKGDILIGVGWQGICTKFHRMHHQSCLHCIESDTQLTVEIPEGQFRLYKCKNNMWDMATNIRVGGKHLGNLFIGQFFFDDEQIDYELFRRQAQQYGFDEKEYMSALEQVPRLSRESIEAAKLFFLSLTNKISKLSYSNIQLARALEDQKRAEKEIFESRAVLKTALDSMTDAVFISDEKGDIIDFNDSFVSFCGLKSRDEVLRKFSDYPTLGDVYFSDGRPAPLDMWATPRALRGEKAINEIYILKNKNTGEIRYGSFSFSPIRNSQNDIVGTVVAARDVTDIKKAEAALRESETKYRELIENVQCVILRWNSEGKITFFNEYAQKLFGYKLDEILGQDVGILVPQRESTGRDLTGLIKDIMENPQRYVNNVNENICKEGRRLWMAWTNKLLYDENGNLSEILAVGTDITERKNAEDSVRESAERFEIMSETAEQLLQSKNPQMIINSLCRKVMEHLDCQVFFNYLYDENKKRIHLNAYAGIPDETFKKIEWLDLGAAICGCVARDGKPLMVENIPETKDLRADLVRSFGIKAFASNPILSHGNVIGTLSFGTKEKNNFTQSDLTLMRSVTDQVAIAMERVRAEEQLLKANEELEEKVRQRTSALSRTVDTLQEEIQLRTQAEKVVKAERKRFEDVLDMLPAYAILLTPDYHVAYANKFFEDRFGQDKGKKCYEYLFNRTEPCENCQTYNVLKTNKPQFWEWVGPDGNNYDIFDYPFRDADGSPLIMEIGLDVTAHKKAQSSLELSEKRYRSLAEATTQVVWTTNAEGQVVFDMPLWRDFTGLNLEQIQGWGWIDSLHPDDRERTAKIWSKAIENGTLYETEYRLLRKDGQYRNVYVRGVPVSNDDGSIREWIGTCTDVTEKKVTEAELEKYRLHLEELVKQRTDELARSNKDLEQFAYVASHDLQEPLRAVAGFVDLLKMRMGTSLDETNLRYMNFAVDGVVRMQTLIQGLLEYSRIGAPRKKPDPINSGKALDRALAQLDRTIKESGAQITSDNLPTVRIDELQLAQVFQNLLCNAIKFKSNDVPRIHISAKKQDRFWQFAVKDNGIGIEKEYGEKIFLIFQRLHTRDKYPGTGIGLSICKKIVERNGGKIWFESERENGSTFYFTVPDRKES
ncbi:MAG: hypothetical protein A2Y10_14405 [Planctomycetes bacterium GWF2_41_51]|nr:MAG: hypothetical protein A2Y10_14405 [Planctomycetes bacterium GWF2_41_51]